MNNSELKKLFNSMTLSEKVGQMGQVTPDFFSNEGETTGPVADIKLNTGELYSIGSILGTHKPEQVIDIQKKYLENNRLGIPLMFMADVIHGYETIFPIPLALASTFDTNLVKKVAQLSSKEAVGNGIHVTFSPMADLVRDPRWGRVLESNGEDPHLSSKLTQAYVEGYQGESLLHKNTLASCVKHFLGYGSSEAGRDYNTVSASDLELYQNHLPAFKAAIEAQVKLVMTSFNTVKGIPSSANKWLLGNVLRKELGFDGIIISDWGAIQELINHRIAEDSKEATRLAVEAGVDIDMMTSSYIKHLGDFIEDGEINIETINQAVWRILTLKNELGLFEDPYRGLMKLENLDQNLDNIRKELEPITRSVASDSLVLLKNEGILPIKTKSTKVGLIGPKAQTKDLLGAWSWIGDKSEVISIYEGLQEQFERLTLSTIDDTDSISKQDLVIVALGENSDESGEAASRSSIQLQQEQVDLLKKVYEINQNVVVLLINGRPLDLTNIVDYCKAILECWFPGTSGGAAIADVLCGRVNPSAKLPMSFPASVGQIPIYYNYLSTGRPKNESNKDEKYISKYLDIANDPLYPFGFGLSFSNFECGKVEFSSGSLSKDVPIKITVTIKNLSNISGKTVVQLYIEDKIAEVARPVRELKGFTKVSVEPLGCEEVVFEITDKDLMYIHSNLKESADKGSFNVYIGFDSLAPKVGEFVLV